MRRKRWLGLLCLLSASAFVYVTSWKRRVLPGSHAGRQGTIHDLTAEYPDISGEIGQAISCHVTRTPYFLMAPSPNIWQTVTSGMYYVYSAYADPRMGSATLIRIFGIIRADRRGGPVDGETYWCQLWLGGDGPPRVVTAELFIQGHADEQYLSAQWSCVLDIEPRRLPNITVSLVINESCSKPSNLLAVHKIIKTNKYVKNLTICVGGVLKREYANYHQLVEWVEVNSMFGADHVVVYDYNSSDILKPYINYYKRKQMMQTIPWTLPDIGDVSKFAVIWNLGQVTAINDCIYRNMYVSRHIASLDLDEFIVPYGDSTSWMEMMRNAGCGNKPVAIVRNAFFGISSTWPEDKTYKRNTLVKNVLKLSTLTRTKQDNYVNVFPKRSKYITRSEFVDSAGIHNVKVGWAIKERSRWLCEVELPYGRLHHYRDPRWKDIEPVDNTFMHQFADDIINRTSQVHKEVMYFHDFA